MTDTDRRADAATPSRRALFALGAAVALGAAAAETVAPIAEAAKPRRAKLYAKPSIAAKKVGTSEVFRAKDARAHLLRRATFGPRPKDVKRLKKVGIDAWVDRQLHPSSIPDAPGRKAWKLFPLAGLSAAAIRHRVEPYSWDPMFETAAATLAGQIFSERQLYEIVVDVFANRLHVPIPGEQWHTSPSYLTTVIRKHALGSFDDMLVAAGRHPALLNYLSNTESRKHNVNENLGRELLELHTVGLAAKYTEKHVRASAAILSGRTWDWEKGTYVYNPDEHVTGRVTVLGFSRANRTGSGGEKVGDDYLRYLARHPSTAKQIARVLAVRFVSDDPSPSLVTKVAKVYRSSGTSIRATVEAIFRSDEFWRSVGTRMRRPLEDAVGAARVLDVRSTKQAKKAVTSLYWNLDAAGHAPLAWGPPNGYPDVATAWLGAGAMVQRWNLHRSLVYGWWKHFAYTPPSKLVKRTKGMTTMAWTRAVAKRLLGVTPSKKHLRAVIAGGRLTASAPAPESDWECGKIATLLLDSPYFQLR